MGCLCLHHPDEDIEMKVPASETMLLELLPLSDPLSESLSLPDPLPNPDSEAESLSSSDGAFRDATELRPWEVLAPPRDLLPLVEAREGIEPPPKELASPRARLRRRSSSGSTFEL